MRLGGLPWRQGVHECRPLSDRRPEPPVPIVCDGGLRFHAQSDPPGGIAFQDDGVGHPGDMGEPVAVHGHLADRPALNTVLQAVAVLSSIAHERGCLSPLKDARVSGVLDGLRREAVERGTPPQGMRRAAARRPQEAPRYPRSWNADRQA